MSEIGGSLKSLSAVSRMDALKYWTIQRRKENTITATTAP
jgi:hypothetical protein